MWPAAAGRAGARGGHVINGMALRNTKTDTFMHMLLYMSWNAFSGCGSMKLNRDFEPSGARARARPPAGPRAPRARTPQKSGIHTPNIISHYIDMYRLDSLNKGHIIWIQNGIQIGRARARARAGAARAPRKPRIRHPSTAFLCHFGCVFTSSN